MEIANMADCFRSSSMIRVDCGLSLAGSKSNGFCIITKVTDYTSFVKEMLMTWADVLKSGSSLLAEATLNWTNRRLRLLVLLPAILIAMAPANAAQEGAPALGPTQLDAFGARPVVPSPDGKLAVTVTGPKGSLMAWLTISPSESPGGPIQVWPIHINGEVLWRPDSNAFVFADNRYANLSYVLVFGTRFNFGEGGEQLGVPVTDLTPVVRKAFDERAQKYYAAASYDTRLFYAKALRWVGSDRLLVGVNAKTVGSESLPHRGVNDWYAGYLIDVQRKDLLRELDSSQLLSQYGISLDKQNW